MAENASAVLFTKGDWTHFNRRNENLISFLRTADLEPYAIAAIQEETTKARLADYGHESLLLILKVLEKNKDGSMALATLRIWMQSDYLFSFQGRDIQAIQNIYRQVHDQIKSSHILKEILLQSADELLDYIESLDGECDRFEEIMVRGKEVAYQKLVHIRTQVLSLRRHLLPQKVAIKKLLDRLPKWISEIEKDLLEVWSKYERIISELEHLRERAHLLQEERENRQNEKLNQRLFYLTLLSAIFLPLTFATGLFGVNLQGIPFGSENWAFPVFCLTLLVLFVLMLAFLRWKKKLI